MQQYFDVYKENWGQIQKAARDLNAQFEGAYDIEVEMYHKDSNDEQHHIGDITELENEISFTFDLPTGMKEQQSGETKKFVLVRVHKNANGEVEYSTINYTLNGDGTFTAKSDLYSDFIWVSIDENDSIPIDSQNEQIKSFVVRFYREILGRSSEDIAKDQDGVNNWTSSLANKTQSGADVAKGFVLSSEFKNKNLNNEQFLQRMYKGFFDRDPDESGYNEWLNKLNQGLSREDVLVGFVNSPEFRNLCAKYEINPGSLEASKQTPQNNNQSNQQSSQRPPLKLDSTGVDEAQLDEFVERLYKNVLGRESDAEGKAYWISAIMNGEDDKGNVYDAAIVIRRGFFESKEYQNMGRNDDEFLTDLYWAFFNREPDAEGYAYWQNKMKNEGYSRQKIVDEGFGHSPEFKNLLTSYGFIILE